MIRHSLPAALAAAASVYFTGCATLGNGSTDNLQLDSTQPATPVAIYNSKNVNVANVVTPAKVELQSNDGPFYLFYKDAGGQPMSYEVKKGVSGWVFGNLLFGGVIGFGIDAATRSLYVLKPDTVNLDLKTHHNLADPEGPVAVRGLPPTLGTTAAPAAP